MIHEKKNGDIVKILPFIIDGKVSWCEQFDIIPLDNKRTPSGVVYDNTGVLRKMVNYYNYKNTSKRVMISRKYFFHSYFNGESKLLNAGKRIFDVITQMDLDVKNNQHLLIKMEMKSVSNGMQLPSFDESSVIEYDWTPPVSDINCKQEWFDWIDKNQPDISRYTKDYSLMNNRSELIDKFGSDILGEWIQKERSEKLEKILN